MPLFHSLTTYCQAYNEVIDIHDSFCTVIQILSRTNPKNELFLQIRELALKI